jgi:hypothetical protein
MESWFFWQRWLPAVILLVITGWVLYFKVKSAHMFWLRSDDYRNGGLFHRIMCLFIYDDQVFYGFLLAVFFFVVALMITVVVL